MSKTSKNNLRLMRKRRVRAKVFGNAKNPRLAVFRSLKNIYVQVIDDNAGKTIASASLSDASGEIKNDIEGARRIGEIIAEKCSKIKISSVVFDRGGYKYHGKVKALAEGARKKGLKF